MARARPTLVGQEFRAGLGVGTVITVLVGLLFLFLGASVDNRPAPIPSFPLWLGLLLLAELSALLVAWGGLVVYFGASRQGGARPSHTLLVLGLLAGALGGGLFLVLLLVTADRRHRSSGLYWPLARRTGRDSTVPAPLSRPTEARKSGVSGTGRSGQSDARSGWITTAQHTARTLEHFLQIFLGIGAVAVFAGGVFLLVMMSRTSEGLGARLAVAVAAVLLLGWIDAQVGWLAQRRRPFSMSGPGESAYRRYQLRSAALLLLAALVLGGLALLLP